MSPTDKRPHYFKHQAKKAPHLSKYNIMEDTTACTRVPFRDVANNTTVINDIYNHQSEIGGNVTNDLKEASPRMVITEPTVCTPEEPLSIRIKIIDCTTMNAPFFAISRQNGAH
mmetsp:Transcript_25218/g.37355  ORF Transcript_25218/g.37355 Transcript_25218/m.37355 type:complete len:114 (+) Transcript_25218:4-345(+)